MPTHYDGSTSEKRALNAFISFSRAFAAVSKNLNEHTSAEGLSSSQFGVLETLYHLGDLSQKELSQKLLVSAGNITCVIDNLERDSFVKRERDKQDRRKINVHLSNTGKKLIQRILPKHVERICKTFSALDKDEQEQFFILCKKLGNSNQKGETK